jgi:hypothetical protein
MLHSRHSESPFQPETFANLECRRVSTHRNGARVVLAFSSGPA